MIRRNRRPFVRSSRDPSRPKTPGYNTHLEIAFTTDKHGRPVAYRWAPSLHRWIRMSLADARHFVAGGEATQVSYTGNLGERLNPRAPPKSANDPSTKTKKADRVLFRVDQRTGDVFAIFPDRRGRRYGDVKIYAWGDFEDGSYFENMRGSRPARPSEYARLRQQLLVRGDLR